MDDSKIERVARIVCYRANKTRVWDDGSVHNGCPSHVNCRDAGVCQEGFNLLRVTTYWQTAREIDAALSNDRPAK